MVGSIRGRRALVVITQLWRRLVRYSVGPAAMVPTPWIVLGPGWLAGPLSPGCGFDGGSVTGCDVR
jgi:hypothetical protein